MTDTLELTLELMDKELLNYPPGTLKQTNYLLTIFIINKHLSYNNENNISFSEIIYEARDLNRGENRVFAIIC